MVTYFQRPIRQNEQRHCMRLVDGIGSSLSLVAAVIWRRCSSRRSSIAWYRSARSCILASMSLREDSNSFCQRVTSVWRMTVTARAIDYNDPHRNKDATLDSYLRCVPTKQQQLTLQPPLKLIKCAQCWDLVNEQTTKFVYSNLTGMTGRTAVLVHHYNKLVSRRNKTAAYHDSRSVTN